MANATADTELLNLLADSGALPISDIMRHFEVTRTAVHQRLCRLLGDGLVDRELVRRGRGRPSYRYSLSRKARRLAGNNFADLAAILWREVVATKDVRHRQSAIKRVVEALTGLYMDDIHGTTLAVRMESLCELLEKRQVRSEVDSTGGHPTFTLRDCPYPDLADVDSTICQVETALFSKLLDDEIVLSQCRLDGHACCQFGQEPKRTVRKAEITV